MSIFAPMKLRKNKRFRLKPFWLVLASCGMVLFYIWLYISVLKLELPGTVLLKKQNAEWQSRIEVIDMQLDMYERTLRGIEERDDNVYRSIYGLNCIPEELKMSGLGDESKYRKYEEKGVDTSLVNTIKRVDQLLKRSYVQSKSFDEIALLNKNAGDMVSCVPSVPPICPSPGQFHLSSRFGARRDPVFKYRRFHAGVDFAARKGFPVYATGDGVVTKVSTKFRGYGNEIIIDHGFGYKTRYAHLSLIEITVGMKIRRGERIGAVGSTGKSTGPHLHYEVIYMGKPVNPLNYMDLAMNTPEFQAMVEQREDESPRSRRTTTSELLRRRRTGK